jgi:hypothetical protein
MPKGTVVVSVEHTYSSGGRADLTVETSAPHIVEEIYKGDFNSYRSLPAKSTGKVLISVQMPSVLDN